MARGRLWGLPSFTLCSLQPSLLWARAPGLGDGSDSGLSDSEESVFSGLEDSGSDSSEDSTEGQDGAGGDGGHGRTEKPTGQPVSGPGPRAVGSLVSMKSSRKESTWQALGTHVLHGPSQFPEAPRPLSLL